MIWCILLAWIWAHPMRFFKTLLVILQKWILVGTARPVRSGLFLAVCCFFLFAKHMRMKKHVFKKLGDMAKALQEAKSARFHSGS